MFLSLLAQDIGPEWLQCVANPKQTKFIRYATHRNRETTELRARYAAATAYFAATAHAVAGFLCAAVAGLGL